jgi:hypothetical protein
MLDISSFVLKFSKVKKKRIATLLYFIFIFFLIHICAYNFIMFFVFKSEEEEKSNVTVLYLFKPLQQLCVTIFVLVHKPKKYISCAMQYLCD